MTVPSKMGSKDTDTAKFDNLMNDSTELSKRQSRKPNKRKCPFDEEKNQGQHHVSLKRNNKAESKALNKQAFESTTKKPKSLDLTSVKSFDSLERFTSKQLNLNFNV